MSRWPQSLPTLQKLAKSIVSKSKGLIIGYEVMYGEVNLTASTLYAALKRLLDAGLVEEVAARARSDDDSRRRYYRLLPAGREVARAEVARLERAVAMARQKRLTARKA